MIRVTLELIPKGCEARKRTLGTIEIANDCTGTEQVGNYHGRLHAEYTGKDGRIGVVKNFCRQRQSAWSLVGAFLKQWNHIPKL